jgi:hypothetical protein
MLWSGQEGVRSIAPITVGGLIAVDTRRGSCKGPPFATTAAGSSYSYAPSETLAHAASGKAAH